MQLMNNEKKDINPDKLPTTTVGVQRLAQREFAKRAKNPLPPGYKNGDPLEKVWDNYQLTKGLKREFKALCKKHDIKSSKYFRACIRALIKQKGDLKKALKEVEKIDTDNLDRLNPV